MSLPGMDFFNNYSFGENMLHNITSWIAGEELQPEVDPAAVQDRYNRQRDNVRTSAGEIGFVGDFKSGIKSCDHFQNPLEELRAKVDKIDLDAVNDLRNAWDEIGKRAETAQTAFNSQMQKATNPGVWRGASAQAVAQGVTDFLASAAKTSQAAKLMARKTEELATGLAPTKELVPHVPEHNSNWENTRSWIAGRGWKDNEDAYNNAWAEAKRVLTTVYEPVLRETDRVPVIPKPHNPTANNVDPGQNDGGRPRGTSTGVQPGGTNDGGQPTANDDTTQPGETEDPSQGQQNSQQQQSNDDTQAASTETPTTPTGTTAPASATPTSPTTPTAPGTPGTPGFPGGPGGPGPGGPGTPTGRPGSSVPGMPGIPGGANPAATRPAAANARTGMSGMPGMGAPGARGKGDDESTKGIPDYLITQEHGDELTGLTDAPKTVPPVIGE
ncbi:hypothetical protein [Nocardia sp. bgisy118]|uniref:hypothetical protein n=1 Tax=Nocardia sp. bgisy118 TaxID=3413786 RepID=UPI003F49E3F6